MTATSADGTQIPAYLELDPGEAEASLGRPVGTGDLGSLSRAHRKGGAEMEGTGSGKDERAARLFSTWEITRYMIPVAQAHFRRVLRGHPDLPQGHTDAAGRARWFTLEDVHELRAFFGTEGSKAKPYLPYRPAGMPARVVTVANAASGVGKTTVAAHLAISAALDGYRVLAVDLDPQGALTATLGGTVADEWRTVFPLIAGRHAAHLRSANRGRIDRGEAPVPLDDIGDAALKLDPADLVQGTRWAGVDLVGAGLDLCRSDVQIPLWRLQSRGWKSWGALGEAFGAAGWTQGYDLIVLDTPPALNDLTVGAVAAAEILLIPTGATASECEGTGRFLDMLQATFSAIETAENVAARALGEAGTTFRWDAVRTVVTRHDPARQAGAAATMQTHLGAGLLPQRQEITPMIGPGAGQARSIYETDYRDFNREAYARGRLSFDDTYAAFKKLLIGTWRRDERAAGETPPS